MAHTITKTTSEIIMTMTAIDFNGFLGATSGDMELWMDAFANNAPRRTPETNTLIFFDLVRGMNDCNINYNVLNSLIRNGADVNHIDLAGRSLLHYIVCHDKVRLARYLLSKGARITGETGGRSWCAIWWPFFNAGGRVVKVLLEHVNGDLSKFLPPDKCGVQISDIRPPIILAIALAMGGDPSQVVLRSHNRAIVEGLLRAYDLVYQVVRWRRLKDESRRLRDTPLVKGARTRSSARVAHRPCAYVAKRVSRFKPLPCVEVANKARRSLEGQVLEFALTRMTSELFKTLVDESFALV